MEILQRKIAPPIVNAVDFSLSLRPYKKFTLKNGVPVYAVQAGSQNVLQLEWVFYAGNFFEEKDSVAAATNFLLRNGTRTSTAFELSESFEFYGAHCNRNCYSETAVISLHTITRHLDNLLPVVQEMISDSVFPQSELDIFKQNAIQKLSVNLQKCEFVAGRLIDSYLYGQDHPYGKFSTAENIAAITREDVVAFYEEYYLHGKCAIFAAGILPDNLEEKLNEYFGSMPLKPADFSLPNAVPSPEKQRKHIIQNDADAVQGAIRIASPFPNRHHPDFKKAMVLNTLFGGYFGSRLMKNIREEKGFTYGIYSYLQNHMQHSAWVVSTEAGKDVCPATVEEVYKEMKRLREEPISDLELSHVKNYMMGSILGDLDGPFHIIARWKNIILNGLPNDHFDNSIAAIRGANSEELQALAQKYLQPELFYELTVY